MLVVGSIMGAPSAREPRSRLRKGNTSYMPLIHRLLAAGALLFLTACASVGFSLFNIPSSLQGGYSLREASYGVGPSEKMDIYVPQEDSSAKHEVIVFFYGGRWQSGKKEDYRFVVRR